jgi:hypothetical protein
LGLRLGYVGPGWDRVGRPAVLRCLRRAAGRRCVVVDRATATAAGLEHRADALLEIGDVFADQRLGPIRVPRLEGFQDASVLFNGGPDVAQPMEDQVPKPAAVSV